MGKSRKIKFKKPKSPGNTRKARLIVRNLPFSATEETLKEHFAPYGDINETLILKRADGKLVGCGFVQFVRKQSAAKAIHYVSGKPFLGRPIIVDWAVPKDKFVNPRKPTKHEDTAKPSDAVNENSDNEVKEEPNSDDDEPEDEHSKEDDEIDEVNSESDSETSIVPEEEEEEKPVTERPAPKPSHDIGEGKTVFLKNVPFDITNDELKACVQQIGPVYYAVVCIDPLTEHSRGTAFVKFKNKFDADECLNSENRLQLKGHTLEPLPALDKKKIQQGQMEKQPVKAKDNRNLYLAKEGAIVAGTSAAKDVSNADMEKRMQLELWKNNMLNKNSYNMFISRTRLIIHNLPANYDDKMLRAIFKKHSPPKARILEAKIMRNLKQVDNDGKPISRGYGFVSFSEHEHALSALRSVNNNPTLFSVQKRPIVAFSIENRAVMLVKRKRMEKSRQNNPLCPESKRTPKPQPDEEKRGRGAKLKKRVRSEDVPTFAGIEAHPGQTKLSTRRKIFSQTAIHSVNVKNAKKDAKRIKQIKEIRKEKKRDPKVKGKPKRANFDERNFSKLVEKYKQKLPSVNLKKWYGDR